VLSLDRLVGVSVFEAAFLIVSPFQTLRLPHTDDPADLASVRPERWFGVNHEQQNQPGGQPRCLPSVAVRVLVRPPQGMGVVQSKDSGCQ
jgi:hypothetical protein